MHEPEGEWNDYLQSGKLKNIKYYKNDKLTKEENRVLLDKMSKIPKDAPEKMMELVKLMNSKDSTDFVELLEYIQK